ncbi:MAG: aminotransferase class V-fold PLP-dependent enzyme [Parvibaculaceae bacterium]
MPTAQRALFDLPDDLAYFNCAYLSPLLNRTVEVGQRSLLSKAHPWTILHRDFFRDVERLRALFADMIDASPDDIAIVSSTASGIATAASGVTLSAGDNVVLPDREHASTYHKWRVQCAAAAAELRAVLPAEGASWADAITAAIDANTRVVSVPNVHWSDGNLFDLERIGAAARAVGALFVIDGTQSIGALPLSVKTLKPDVLTCSAYKWLFCPYGFAFLYVAPHMQHVAPFEEHYFHRAGAAEHEGRLEQIDSYDTGARRFDMGERANFITVPMAITALEQLLDWGIAGINRTIAEIAAGIVEGVRPHGYFAAPPDARSGHLFGLRRDGGLPDGLAQRLRQANVFVSIRGDAIRVSPHVFNTEKDVQRFAAALR